MARRDEGPEISGADWLRKFMEAQAEVMALSMWITFGLGQAAAAGQAGNLEHARKMVDALEGDVKDLADASAQLTAVSGHILANIRRALDEQGRQARG